MTGWWLRWAETAPFSSLPLLQSKHELFLWCEPKRLSLVLPAGLHGLLPQHGYLRAGGGCHPLPHCAHHRWQPGGDLCLPLCPAAAPPHHQPLYPNHGVRWSAGGRQLPCALDVPPPLPSRPEWGAHLQGIRLHGFCAEECFHGLASLHQRGPLHCHHTTAVVHHAGHPMPPEGVHCAHLGLLCFDFPAIVFPLGETRLSWGHI